MPDDTDKTLNDAEDADTLRKRAPRARKAAVRLTPAAMDEPSADDDLPAVPPRSSGGGGAVWVAIILVVVAVLVAGVWLKHRSNQRAAEASRQQQLALISDQLSRVQTRVKNALRELEQPEPDVDRAIESLNDAAEGVTQVAQYAAGEGQGVADQLVRLQGDIRTASQGLEQDRAQYEEKVKAAREELKLAATRRVRPIVDDLRIIGPSLGASPEQPLPPRVTTPTPPASEAAPEPTGAPSAPSETTQPAPGAAGEAAPASPAPEATPSGSTPATAPTPDAAAGAKQ